MRFRDLPGFSRLFVDWIENAPSARAFLPASRRLEDARERAIDLSKSGRIQRREIHELLARQVDRFEAGPHSLKNTERLLLPDCVVVACSLPPVFAGGALEIFLKCISAAKIAGELEKRSISAVPLCWLDSGGRSDADRLSIGILDRDAGFRRLSIDAHAPQRDEAIAGRIPDNAAALFPALAGELGADPDGAAMQSLARAFAPGTPFSLASARFISSLLAEWGFVFFDAGVQELKERALQLLEGRKIRVADALVQSDRQKARLRREGYAPDSQENDAMPLPDLASRLVIETCFPVAAHVVDEHELWHVASVFPVFDASDARPAPIVPRGSATILDARVRKIMMKYGLGYSDLLRGKPGILGMLAREEPVRVTMEKLESIERAAEDALNAVEGESAGAAGAGEILGDTRSRLLFQIGKLRERYAAASSQRREVIERQLDRVFNSVLPGGCLQERAIASLCFLLRHAGDLSGLLYDRLNIESAEHQLISVE